MWNLVSNCMIYDFVEFLAFWCSRPRRKTVIKETLHGIYGVNFWTLWADLVVHQYPLSRVTRRLFSHGLSVWYLGISRLKLQYFFAKGNSFSKFVTDYIFSKCCYWHIQNDINEQSKTMLHTHNIYSRFPKKERQEL